MERHMKFDERQIDVALGMVEAGNDAYDFCKRLFDLSYDKHSAGKLTAEEEEQFTFGLFGYLASGGFVADNNARFLHKFLRELVPVLFSAEFALLRDADPFAADFDEEKYYEAVLKLRDAIDEAYIANNGKRAEIALTGNIMLATYACAPSYCGDARASLNAAYILSSGYLTKRVLRKTVKLIYENGAALRSIAEKAAEAGKNYPIFKCLDIALCAEIKEE